MKKLISKLAGLTPDSPSDAREELSDPTRKTVELPGIYSGRPGPEGNKPDCEGATVLQVDATVIAAHSGPDRGIAEVQACLPGFEVTSWTHPEEWACGHSLSMYDASPTTGIRSGNPIADCYSVIGYPAGAILTLADGVNWGEPARRAARCAVLAATAHLHQLLASLGKKGGGSGHVTSDVLFEALASAFKQAHALIKRQMGSLTTLVISVVCPTASSQEEQQQHMQQPHVPDHQQQAEGTESHSLAISKLREGAHPFPAESSPSASPFSNAAPSITESAHAEGSTERGRGEGSTQVAEKWAVLTAIVGDSPAFVWRAKEQQAEELTLGSHKGALRDARWTPGAVGHALGDEPDLSNLTLSYTSVSEGDIVFLGSDGMSDNFDPIMLKRARHAPYASEVALASTSTSQIPYLSPDQVHAMSLQIMTDTLRDILSQSSTSALHEASDVAQATEHDVPDTGKEESRPKGRAIAKRWASKLFQDIGLKPTIHTKRERHPSSNSTAAPPVRQSCGLGAHPSAVNTHLSLTPITICPSTGGGSTPASSFVLGSVRRASSSRTLSTLKNEEGERGRLSTMLPLQRRQQTPSSPVVEQFKENGRAESGEGCIPQEQQQKRGQEGLTAQSLVEGLLRQVYQVTEPQRQHIKNGDLASQKHGDVATPSERSLATDRLTREDEDEQKKGGNSGLPEVPGGKLDHTTVVAYQVGRRTPPEVPLPTQRPTVTVRRINSHKTIIIPVSPRAARAIPGDLRLTQSVAQGPVVPMEL